jgi:alpha/beta superfamily hydrolase
VERLSLAAADGVELEAELAAPDGAWAAVVLAHPHPLYGGSMRTGVPAALFEALPAAGVAALRFNFRGVEGSSGVHDHGVAERLDVAAAVDALASTARAVPLVVCGWSFGADVSLCVVDPRIAGWCAVAPPLAVAPRDDMLAAPDPRPKHLLVPEHDQYDPPARATATTADWVNTTIEVVPMADHFLAGALGRVAASVLTFLRAP